VNEFREMYLKKAIKRIILSAGVGAALIGGIVIGKQGQKMLDLQDKLGLRKILEEMFPEVEKWTIWSVVFPKYMATTVCCPAQLLADNPDAAEKVKQACLDKVPDLAGIRFSLKLKAFKNVRS